MKKNKLAIIISLFIILIIGVFIININPNAETTSLYKKGDLRCPQNKSNNSVTCVEKKDDKNNVIEVELTYKQTDSNGSNIEILKKVTKKEKLGYYDVEFNVKGDSNSQKPTSGPIYIVVVADRSATNSSKLKSMKNAIEAFSNKLYENGNPNIYLGVVIFGGKSKDKANEAAKTVRKLTNKPLTKDNIDAIGDSVGKKSYLGRGYAKARSLFKNVEMPSNAKKYIVLYGDGQYWYDSHDNTTQTDIADLYNQYQALKKENVKVYGIRFKNGGEGGIFKSTSNTSRGWCKKDQSYGTCNDNTMGKITSEWYYEGKNLSQQFIDLVGTIEDDAGVSGTTFDATLKDNIGNEFELSSDDTSRTQEFNVGELTKEGKTFGPFEIEIKDNIDPKAGIADGLEEGWHKTNDKFTFSYTDTNGEKQTITVKDNPEVYWVEDPKNFKSCYDSIETNTLKDPIKNESSFYSITCSEGYMNDKNEVISGLRATVNVNNFQNMGFKNFSLLAGAGFPTTISLSTNVSCKYEFHYKEFNDEYDKIKNSLNKAQAESKEYYSLYNDLQEYNAILDNYISIVSTSSNLKNYETNFINQPATLTIKYNDSKQTDQINFINAEEPSTNVYCDKALQTANIGDKKNVEVNKTCYASFSKIMKLPSVCLSMQSGESQNCSDNNNQLDGGNNYYTKTKQLGGKVLVEIPKTGYQNNIDFILDNDTDGNPACTFDLYKKDVIYRQIDLNDPFIQNYDNAREIGKNYLNDKFDFRSIIHSDTWSQNYEYDYKISKVNIQNIRKDTAEDSRSYLGKNCYFSNNKYICEFTRNMQNGNTLNENKWFYAADIME